MATASMNNGSVTDVALSIDKSECYAKNEHPVRICCWMI